MSVGLKRDILGRDWSKAAFRNGLRSCQKEMTRSIFSVDGYSVVCRDHTGISQSVWCSTDFAERDPGSIDSVLNQYKTGWFPL